MLMALVLRHYFSSCTPSPAPQAQMAQSDQGPDGRRGHALSLTYFFNFRFVQSTAKGALAQKSFSATLPPAEASAVKIEIENGAGWD